MRYVLLAALAVVTGVVQLAFGWRVSVLGATPDLLFLVAFFASLRLRPGEAVPVACGIGLFADFLVGSRLGLMALGYAAGIRVVEWLMPLWAPDRERSAVARAITVVVLVLAGAFAAHALVAALGSVVGEGTMGVAGRLGRAAMIALLTGVAAPFAGPVIAPLIRGPQTAARRGVAPQEM